MMDIVLNNVVVRQRSKDKYIEIEKICEAGSKKFIEWQLNFSSFVNTLQEDKTNQNKEVVEFDKVSKTWWGHPLIALNIARWISIEFEIQVSQWIFDSITKNFENTIELQNTNLQRLRKLLNENNKRHKWFKFQENGSAFYIITSGNEYKDNHYITKFGIAGCPQPKKSNSNVKENREINNIDSRLATHRTLWPSLQIKLVVFTNDAVLLEKCIKREFQDFINPSGHELIYNIDPDIVVSQAIKFLELFNCYNKEPLYKISNMTEEYNTIAISQMRNINESSSTDLVICRRCKNLKSSKEFLYHMKFCNDCYPERIADVRRIKKMKLE